MAESPTPGEFVHFERYGDRKTACGKVSVPYRTALHEFVTCQDCKKKMDNEEITQAT